jgi:hypothetical protein
MNAAREIHQVAEPILITNSESVTSRRSFFSRPHFMHAWTPESGVPTTEPVVVSPET